MWCVLMDVCIYEACMHGWALHLYCIHWQTHYDSLMGGNQGDVCAFKSFIASRECIQLLLFSSFAGFITE